MAPPAPGDDATARHGGPAYPTKVTMVPPAPGDDAAARHRAGAGSYR
jgi:hypothetical protein